MSLGVIVSPIAVVRGALAAALVFLGASAVQSNDNLDAFEQFVAVANYADANFYLSNGFIAADDVDSSQLFKTVLVNAYGDNLSANARDIEQLYAYLSGLGPIDLNTPFSCGDGDCLLVDWLAHGYRTNEIAWFVSHGLDLNQRLPEFVPATLPMIIRLGGVYGMKELNWFVANGMVLGDETYSIEELLNYRDGNIDGYPYQSLIVPDNFLNLGEQNLLDVLVITLATDMRGNARDQARRRDVLCSFITYAAAAYTPSYDYLRHLLQSVDEFRGKMIGRQVRGDGGVYAPFPTSCVLLVKAMATSHTQLEQITSEFANQGDVPTASWLLSIQQSRN